MTTRLGYSVGISYPSLVPSARKTSLAACLAREPRQPVALTFQKGSLTRCLSVQLSFYGFYHQKGGNQLIHFFFVPAILWSVDVWFAHTGALWGVDLPAHLTFLPSWLAGYVQRRIVSPMALRKAAAQYI